MPFRCLARAASVAAAVLLLSPAAALACACGCGVFDVGTGSMFAGGSGTTAFLEYDFLNQRQNWHGTSKAPAAGNEDKKVRTDFFTAGVQHMFDRDWGVMAEVPVWSRHFETDGGGVVAGFNHTAIGDMRLMGIYTGFSADMSTGVTFGVKLPTGDSGYSGFDPDTEIGTGSTDLLLGVYHQGALDSEANFIWFGQASGDLPVMHKGGYRPGAEFDAALGAYYNSWYLGAETKIAPVVQMLASFRGSDGGAYGDPANTGYQRFFVSPGVEFDTGNWKVYGDVEFPVYQYMRGDQLIGPEQYKLIVSYAL